MVTPKTQNPNTVKKAQGFGSVEIVNVGGFDLRKYGSLIQLEMEWFESQSDARIKSIKAILELAKTMAETEGMDEDKALECIQDLENPEYKTLLFKYADRLDSIRLSNYTESQFKRDVTQLMLNSRVPRKFIMANVDALADEFGIEVDEAFPEFTLEDIKKLPTKIISEVCEFATNEKTEWAIPEETEAEPEDLGK